MNKEKISKALGFSKQKLLSFPRYLGRKDLLNAILEEGKSYTIEKTEELINKFMKGSAK